MKCKYLVFISEFLNLLSRETIFFLFMVKLISQGTWLVMQDDVRLVKGIYLVRQMHIGSVMSIAVGEI